MAIKVELLVTETCPHASLAQARVEQVLQDLAPEVTLVERTVRDTEEALALRFPGSPTVRINGVDLEADAAPPPAFACRRYGHEGAPPPWLIEAAVLRALAPRHVLFLCVANSARSQMAEALARSQLAKKAASAPTPGTVKVSSAGSEPTSIRPEALRVLSEIGIDARSQRAKGMETIENDVDAVITLCAEEVCPAWLGKAWRVHWGLPDPAAVHGTEAERLDAFRSVRDELRRRLRVLFSAG